MISASTIKLLRIPFSFFLSPVYFFALAQVPHVDWEKAALIFVIIHFLIYPASNGYNSYMDRDTKSIGGLEHPPPPSRELYFTTMFLDLVGISLSLLISPLFAFVMLFYIGASKAYSYRGIRIKRLPITGYLLVVVFQGAVTFWLVYYGSNIDHSLAVPWEGMAICALLIGGFYPLTQIYQHEQDLDDGVVTISYMLGYKGTFVFCAIVYSLAFTLMAQFFIQQHERDKLLMVSIFFVPIIVYFVVWFLRVSKNAQAANFKNTMIMNWLAATCTNISFVSLLIWKWLE